MVRNRLRKSQADKGFAGTNIYNVIEEDEDIDYPFFCTTKHIFNCFKSMPDNSLWNAFMCVLVMGALLTVAMNLRMRTRDVLDVAYNVIYAIHVLSIAYDVYVMDSQQNSSIMKHGSLNDYHLKVSIMGTALKYLYYFLVLRITWAIVWIAFDQVLHHQQPQPIDNLLAKVLAMNADTKNNTSMMKMSWRSSNLSEYSSPDDMFNTGVFISAVYIVNKMFIPIGPSVHPVSNLERASCLLVMISGCLVVTGVAVASLSSVISVYQRPQEAFKARFRLIMEKIHQSHVPVKLRAKVATFYNIYWHNQKAVSSSQLLQTFPPSVPVSVYTDIYFEALQKNRMFRDLSDQFLSEIAKKMETIHYIPGDVIIKRSSKKTSMIYITYGDIEMVTAEDDNTAILGMTRGTLLSGFSAYIPIACARAHVQIRAATFCTAQLLSADDLWKVTLKHGRSTNEGMIMLYAFYNHFDKVQRHYDMRYPEPDLCKSSILNFKQNLMILKELKDDNGEYILSNPDKFLEIAKSYVMRNGDNIFEKEETDAICLRSSFPCILQPYSSLQFVWNSLICILILFVIAMYPYYLVYRKTVPLSFRIFDYILTLIFCTDLIVHLSTGANVEAGVPITFKQTSMKQMKSFWFFLDVLAVLPIFELIGEGHFAGINKLLKLNKIFTYLRNIQDEFVYYSDLIKLIFYTLLTLIACYLIAALQQAFMCFYFDYCQVLSFTSSPYWGQMPLDDDTVDRRMSFAMFWSMSLISFTAHLQTFGTENWNTFLYIMVVLEICIVLHVFIEAFYSASIMITSALREEYDAVIAQAKNFLIKNNVDPVLRHRFTQYLELTWYTEKSYSMTHKKSILFDLPPHVYQDIVARRRSKYILSIPFMKFLNPEMLKSISSKAVLFYTSPNEILLHTGDISNEIYVVKQGICEVLDPETHNTVNLLEEKGTFGILESVLRIPAYYTVRAVTHVEIVSISRRHLLEAFETVPTIANAIKFAKEQPEYLQLLSPRNRFLEYVPPAKLQNRMYFKLLRKHEKDDQFLQPFLKLGNLSILKYIFPRFTIRPDGMYIKRYEWFRGILAFLSAVIVPGYAYLILQFPFLYYVLLLLDLSAYLDILQRMLVGYFDNDGILIWHPAATAVYYLKGSFITDLFACLPLENLDTYTHGWIKGANRISTIHQYLMLNRLIQLYRLPSAMISLKEIIERRDVVVVIKFLPYILVFYNVMTCRLVLKSVDFVYRSDKYNYYILPRLTNGESWINIFNTTFRFNLTESALNIHLASYFWIVYEGTTTGYNVMNPTNIEQMWTLYATMFLGSMATTYMAVKIISIRANVNTALAAYQENLKDLIMFMRSEKIDRNLQNEIMKYYTYNWDKQGGVEYRNVLKLCDQITLRTDAVLHLYGATFAKCPLLAGCDSAFIRILGRAVRSVHFLKHTRIFEVDDILSDFYFIDYGTVEVRNSNNNWTAQLDVGSIFGNLVCDLGSKTSVVFKAATDVHLLCINGRTFWNISSNMSNLRNLLRLYILENKDFIEVRENLKSPSQNISLISRRSWVLRAYYNETVLQVYLIIVSVLSVYLEIYNAGFQINTTSMIIGLYILDVAFIGKIFMIFFMPNLLRKKLTQKFAIRRNTYFKCEFYVDVLSSVPFELLSLGGTNNMWNNFSVLRLNRVLRSYTISKCLNYYHERLGINLTMTTTINVLIWSVLFIHANACFWYYLGQIQESNEPKSSWLYKVYIHSRAKKTGFLKIPRKRVS